MRGESVSSQGPLQPSKMLGGKGPLLGSPITITPEPSHFAPPRMDPRFPSPKTCSYQTSGLRRASRSK